MCCLIYKRNSTAPGNGAAAPDSYREAKACKLVALL